MRTVLAAALLSSLCACTADKPTGEATPPAATPAAAAPAADAPAAAPPSTPAPAAAATAPAAGAVTKVADVSLVCMVNDQFMGRPQIPVDVGGRTYYGCCENCKAKLANDETARTATDPVSGEKVDKATAIIGQEPSGKVHYFASEANLTKFAATP